MEKKTYIAPKMNVHSLKLDNVILAASPTELHSGDVLMGVQTAFSKGMGGPIFDDEDYDEFDDDF